MPLLVFSPDEFEGDDPIPDEFEELALRVADDGGDPPFTEDMAEILKIMAEEAHRAHLPGAYHRPVTAFTRDLTFAPTLYTSRTIYQPDPLREKQVEERAKRRERELEEWQAILKVFPFDKLQPSVDISTPEDRDVMLQGPSFFIPYANAVFNGRVQSLVQRANKYLAPARFTYREIQHEIEGYELDGIGVWRLPADYDRRKKWLFG